MRVISGKREGATGIVVAKVFQRSTDLPDEYTPSYHVALDRELDGASLALVTPTETKVPTEAATPTTEPTAVSSTDVPPARPWLRLQ